MQIVYYSAKNPTDYKPNEDFMLADQQNSVFIVCDGITRTHIGDSGYPDPSPAAMAARIVATDVHVTFLEQLSKVTQINENFMRTIFEYANKQLDKFNIDSFTHFDLAANDRAGACAVVAVIHSGQLHLAGIGDCEALVHTTKEVIRFTGNTYTKLQAIYPPPLSDQRTEKVRSHRNKIKDPMGYGALTGEAGALDFLKYQSIDIDQIKTIYLYSDGIDALLNRYKPEYDQLELEELDKLAVQAALSLNQRLDDRTLIRVIM